MYKIINLLAACTLWCPIPYPRAALRARLGMGFQGAPFRATAQTDTGRARTGHAACLARAWAIPVRTIAGRTLLWVWSARGPDDPAARASAGWEFHKLPHLVSYGY